MASPFKEMLSLDPTREQVEAWCRQRAQAVPAGNDALLCRVLGKYLMYVHQRDYALTPHLAMNGIWEPWVTMAIARHVKPGMRCMDVGACYGYYSLLMADIVGSDGGYVEAWEPHWDDLLRQNMALSGSPVNVIEMALGTFTQDVLFLNNVPSGRFNAGDCGWVRRAMTYAGDSAIDRRVAYVGLPSPHMSFDFVKVDVEGGEMDVWEALVGVRSISPNLTVCMEFTPKQHKDPRAALESIVAGGFLMGSVGHDGVPRLCTIDRALEPDTGDFRMLWLTRDP